MKWRLGIQMSKSKEETLSDFSLNINISQNIDKIFDTMYVDLCR